MAELTADQIVERIANANSVEPAVIRQRLEPAIQSIIASTAQRRSSVPGELFCGKNPTMGKLVVALETELYDALMPDFSGWEWGGVGYRNTGLSEGK